MRYLTPQNISSYRLIELLGEGLSSSAHKAIREDAEGFSQQCVVLKILKSKNAVSRLQNEFEALARVESANCVRVLGWENFADGPALVLEHIDGVTLYELTRAGALSQGELTEIRAQVHQGLIDLRDAGVYHGDLSPKNIMIDVQGRVKLIDFGSLSSDTEIFGTPPYISWQVWNGEPRSYKTDLASWRLIEHDIRTGFLHTPKTDEAARTRAHNFAALAYDPKDEKNFLQTKLKRRVELSIKVEALLASRASVQTTAVCPHAEEKPCVKLFSGWLFALIVIVISTPGFSELKSEPAGVIGGTLWIRTMNWTEIKIDKHAVGFAPVRVRGLLGHHSIQWRRAGHTGQIEINIQAQEIKRLTDRDFNY